MSASVSNPYATGAAPPPGGRGGPGGAPPPAMNPYTSGGGGGGGSPPPGLQEPLMGGTSSAADKHSRLQQVLRRFEISIAEAQDLVVLQDYEIVIIADDSGSMRISAMPPAQRPLPGSGKPDPSRWDELKATVAMVVEIATVFDEDGLDIYFLNRPPLKNVTSMNDPRLAQSFQQPPSGTTPLTRCLTDLVKHTHGDKPVLLVIATDGVPDGGPGPFVEAVESIVTRRTTSKRFRLQMMACTADDEAIGWMNQLDSRFKEVDVTDDYYSERDEVLRAGRMKKFNRSDWVIKALLGPVSQKFDGWDEGGGKPAQGGRGGHGGGGGGGNDDGCCTVL
eukprot:TRINITY_DN19013_c2_g4_i1.p1 TRINITY_DN19013_c2_g4~~TRINITY_DN19013_c2_g4_i1.p1  ORF type:complete len:358 (+),score=110.33 TRINITY_DN19013_c2_g4_i1:70-1074(+)